MRLIFAFLTLFIWQASAIAQQGDTRTATTKVADLLALQPAETPERFAEAMSQLERFTASDITVLLTGLVPPGKGNNTAIEYAANSYSFHVLAPGKERYRATFIQGAIDALQLVTDKDNRGFIIQLLQQAGDDTAVDALTPYLLDGYLSEKASRALSRIGTLVAGKRLLEALNGAPDSLAVNLIDGIGFMAYAPAEEIVRAHAGSRDINVRKAVWYALSRIGSPESAPVLAKAAADAGYVYEPSGATAAYINYGFRLAELGHQANAAKVASTVAKRATDAHQVHTRAAALGLLVKVNGEKYVRKLISATRDAHPVYRNAALRELVPYLNDAVGARLVNKLSRADADVQMDILRFVGEHRLKAALPEIQRIVRTGSPAVRPAAVQAWHLLDDAGSAQQLIDLIPTSDAGTRQAIRQALLTSSAGDLPAQTLAALRDATDEGTQRLLVDVLAQRGYGESVPVLIDLIRAGASTEVRADALAALPLTARPIDLAALLDLLPQVDRGQEVAVQQAAVSAVLRSDDRDGLIRRVIGRINDAPNAVKPRFFPILSGVGGTDALALISGFCDQSDSALRAGAVSAVASWTDVQALPKLIELSRQQWTDGDLQNRVVRGLVRLVAGASFPAEQKVLYLRDAFEVARTVDQKRAILQALEANKTYNALIFAGQYLDDPELRNTAVNTVMNIALENKSLYGTDVTNLLQKVISLLSGSESSYLREAVQKHLNELPTGGGFVSLFNGKDLEGWKGLVENPIARAKLDAKTLEEKQRKADEVMRQGWYVEDGVLHFNGHGDNIATVKQYGDFEMLVDWKLDRHGKDGDAGIYLRGTPQVQIWDTSRADVGAQVGSGGLYNNQTHESKPLKVADNPLGEWNTFRIVMVGDRVTVYLNGELVTDNVVLENYWDRSLPIFPKEQIELQAHGTHVSYRDIYIREIPRKETFVLPESEQREGFEVLFDGTNMNAWTGNTTAYRISEEGTLAIYPTEGSGGNLYTKEQFTDFIYRFEFRLTPGANNGVGIRTPMEGDAAYVGMEIQVLDDTAEIYKDLEPYQYHGSVYGIIPAKRGYLRPVGKWNEEEIRIQGNKIKVTLNGTVIVDGDLAEVTKNGTLDGKDHPGLKRKSGHLAFLGHGSEVHFRNIRIKRL